MPKQIICADALKWLPEQCPPCAIITSLPLEKETGIEQPGFDAWYRHALMLCMRAVAPGVPCIIYQTDTRSEGQLFSKSAVIIATARSIGLRVLWHKIVLRRGVGLIDIHRPGYSHLIAIGDRNCKPGTASPDVMARGPMLYPNAMGLIPAVFAVDFAACGKPIVDPFCGRGTVPAVADSLGHESIGVDIDPEQCRHAEALSLARHEAVNAAQAGTQLHG